MYDLRHRPQGATLAELNRATGWDAFSYINDTKGIAWTMAALLIGTVAVDRSACGLIDPAQPSTLCKAAPETKSPLSGDHGSGLTH